MATSTSSASGASLTSNSPDEKQAGIPDAAASQPTLDWPSLALGRDFLENLENDDDDFEVSRMANTRPTSNFDRRVGSRNLSSGSTGSTGFYDALETSPTASVSPILADFVPKTPNSCVSDEDTLLSNLKSMSLFEENPSVPAVQTPVMAPSLNDFVSGQNTFMENIAALAKLDQMQQQPYAPVPSPAPFRMNQFNNAPGFNNYRSPAMNINGSSLDLLPMARMPSKVQTVSHTQMQIRCKFGMTGASPGQFNMPHGFCTGINEEIMVADTQNHRVQVNKNCLKRGAC